MRSFLRLHQDGELVLVNPDQIQTIWSEADDNNGGSTIYFAGEPDGLSVDESLEYITALIAITEHG